MSKDQADWGKAGHPRHVLGDFRQGYTHRRTRFLEIQTALQQYGLTTHNRHPDEPMTGQVLPWLNCGVESLTLKLDARRFCFGRA